MAAVPAMKLAPLQCPPFLRATPNLAAAAGNYNPLTILEGEANDAGSGLASDSACGAHEEWRRRRRAWMRLS